MICGKMQGLIIKKNAARTPAKMAYYRRLMREHVRDCKFCLRQLNRTYKTKYPAQK